MNWQAVNGADGYQVYRSEALVDVMGNKQCQHTSLDTVFQVEKTQFLDQGALPDSAYCYRVVALNSRLFSGVTSQSSPYVSGVRQNQQKPFPFVQNQFRNGTTHSIRLPLFSALTGEYQIALTDGEVTDSITTELLKSGDDYDLLVQNLPEVNQQLIFNLKAVERGEVVHRQVFSVVLSGFDNQPPVISLLSSSDIEINQHQQITLDFVVNDDQPVYNEALSAYSTDKSLIDEVKLSKNSDGGWQVSAKHVGFSTGRAEIVIQYSDGEINARKSIDIHVKRSSFNRAKVQNTTWYVSAGSTVSRLLPYWDIDSGENNQLILIQEPQNGSLSTLSDTGVTYQANADFNGDQFSFTVVGEDGISSDEATVILKTPPADNRQPITQKVISEGYQSAFLSHRGELYLWGRNHEQSLAQPADIAVVEKPTLVSGVWIDVALEGRETYAIRQDGSLWVSGYRNGELSDSNSAFVRVGDDSDWKQLFTDYNSGAITALKTDGTVWRSSSSATFEFEQYLPIANVTSITKGVFVSFARLDDDRIFSYWEHASGHIVAGRENSKHVFLDKIDGVANINSLATNDFSAFAVTQDGNLLHWGRDLAIPLLEQDNTEPVMVGSDKWQKVSYRSAAAGIKQDGSLWSWGGYVSINGKEADNAWLGRGSFANRAFAQVGNARHWLNVWSGNYSLFALDEDGQLWAAGTGELFGQGEDELVHELRSLAIPLQSTGVTDFDQDGIQDRLDVDDDNDGVPDHFDDFPYQAAEQLDSDGDGIGNNADSDDDNDGVPDSSDNFPLDPSRSSAPTPPTQPTEVQQSSSSGGVINVVLYFWLLVALRRFKTTVKGNYSDKIV